MLNVEKEARAKGLVTINIFATYFQFRCNYFAVLLKMYKEKITLNEKKKE